MMSLEVAEAPRVKKEPEWEDNRTQALQFEHEVKQERAWEGEWTAQDSDVPNCEMNENWTNREIVAYTNHFVEEELTVEPEQLHQTKHIQSHVPLQHGDHNRQSIITSSSNKNSLIIQSIPITETLNKCDHCSFATDSEESLQEHEKIHYVCVYCKYTAASEVSLLLHVSSHASEKPKTYAKRGYPSAKIQNQDAQSGLYTKHWVKKKLVNKTDTQVGYKEHEVKERVGASEDGAHVKFYKNKQLLLRQTEVLKSKANIHTVQANMYTEHEAGSEPASEDVTLAVKLVAGIVQEVKNEPGSEMGLMTGHLQHKGEGRGRARAVSAAAACAGLYTGHTVKEELVVGPEEVYRPELFLAGPTKLKEQNEQSMEKSVMNRNSLTLHSTPVTEKSHTCYDPLYYNKNAHTEKIISYKCAFCSFVSANIKDLQSHQRTHTGVKAYKCAHCSYVTASRIDFKAHLRANMGEKPYKCILCNLPCACRNMLVTHLNLCLNTHTDAVGKYKRTYCSYATFDKTSLNVHERVHNGKVYKCAHCSFASTHKISLINHVKRHGEKLYKCIYCNFACDLKYQLKFHESSTHADKKLYKCAYCNFVTTRKKIFTPHVSMHTGENPYKCTLCSYTCMERRYLKLHERTHTGEKPYKCGQCSYACAQISNIRTHEKTHSSEKPYKCAHCSYASAFKRGLKHHLNRHLGKESRQLATFKIFE